MGGMDGMGGVTQEELRRKIRASQFPRKNGQVLMCVNLINRHGYTPLEQVEAGAKNWDVSRGELMDAFNFLAQEGYLESRSIRDHVMNADLADYSYRDIEVRLSGKGIRLLQGTLADPCVEV